MRSRACTAFRALCSIIFLIVAASTGLSQSEAKSDTKRSLAEFVRQKAAGNGFVLLKPSDLAKLPEDVRNNLRTGEGDPCDMAEPIYFTQGFMKALANTDCQLDDGSYADFYYFDGLAGEPMQIDMTSSAFDPYLGVANETGTWVLEDDDGGGASNARIIATLPESGMYVILANSFDPNSFGSYWISLGGGPACSFTFNPTPPVNIPHTAGTYSFNVSTQSRCYWAAYSLGFEATTTSTGLGDGTVSYSVIPNNVNQQRVLSIGVRNAQFTVVQAPMPCNYTLSNSSVNVGAFATSGSFDVSAPTGCFWSASGWSYFLQATGNGNGNGTVNYTVMHNNGPPRVGNIQIREQPLFTVNQEGLNCTYSVTPMALTVPAIGMTGNYIVNTQPGCTWHMTRNQLWADLPTGMNSGPKTLPFTIAPHSERSSRSAAFQFSYNLGASGGGHNTWIDQLARRSPAADFDGDFKSDISIFRPAVAEWWINRSSTNATVAAQFGNANDKLVPADYTGDGKVDIAIYRPESGEWYILRSEDSSFFSFPFGTPGDVPVPALYDGDSRADAAVFRPSNSTWYIRETWFPQTRVVQWGSGGDVPVPGDYDADNEVDIAIYRPSVGQWWINRSNDGVLALTFGNATDKPVQGDFTGDGRTDVALWRPTTGEWFILRSQDLTYYSQPFGASGDVPAPGDYDGDGIYEPTVFRPSNSTWYSQRSTSGTLIRQFGTTGDKPVPNVFVP